MRPSYTAVFFTFLRNSLIREMTFRANFIIECFSSVTWTLMNLGFYLLIFHHTDQFGSGWGKWEFFVFLSTTMIVNSIVQAFFMQTSETLLYHSESSEPAPGGSINNLDRKSVV